MTDFESSFASEATPSAAASLSSSPVDNPWESAANDNAWREEASTTNTNTNTNGNVNGSQGRFRNTNGITNSNDDYHYDPLLPPSFRNDDNINNNNGNNNNNNNNSLLLSSCGILPFAHLLDIIMGMTWLIYTFLELLETSNKSQQQQQQQQQHVLIVMSMSLAGILSFRGIWFFLGHILVNFFCGSNSILGCCGFGGGNNSNNNNRCCYCMGENDAMRNNGRVWMSKILSLLFAMIYAITTTTAWILYFTKGDACKLLPNTTTTNTNTTTTTHFCQEFPKALPFALFGFTTLELVRYFFLQRQIRYWQDEEEINQLNLLNNSSTTGRSGTTPHNRNPWWWRGGNHRTSGVNNEPLLGGISSSGGGRPHWSSNDSIGYQMEEGVGGSSNNNGNNNNGGSSSGGWWPFGSRGRRGNNNNNNNNPRDDGSVDYASLNEDWASRSEEDPFWWAQD